MNEREARRIYEAIQSLETLQSINELLVNPARAMANAA